MRLRIGSTFAVIAIAAGLAASVAGPIYSALGGSAATSSATTVMASPSRIIR
jgi:hypothetical protein